MMPTIIDIDKEKSIYTVYRFKILQRSVNIFSQYLWTALMYFHGRNF